MGKCGYRGVPCSFLVENPSIDGSTDMPCELIGSRLLAVGGKWERVDEVGHLIASLCMT